MKRVLLAILAAVLCFALASCDAKRISESKVEKAELNGHLLPEEDLNTFIYWFNKAEYKGEGTGEGRFHRGNPIGKDPGGVRQVR